MGAPVGRVGQDMSDQYTFDGDFQDLWKRVRDELESRLPRAKHTAFVRPLALEERGGDAIALKGSQFVIVGLKKHGIAPLVKELFNQCAGREISIEFLSVPVERAVPAAPPAVARAITEVRTPPETFEGFVVGSSNKLAFHAARRVAREPGEGPYNPLFIYGPSGLGKTHLLRAIQNEVGRLHPTLVVRYMMAQEFSEEFIHSLQSSRINQFRSRIRSANVWLLDDIQFIEKRGKTTEELYHSFNRLHQEGRQIVLAADRPPHALSALEERLRSRFEGGLLAEVLPPDTETRKRILEAKAEVEAVPCPPDILEWIAVNGPTNVRSLIGAFNRVIAFASMSGGRIDIDLARSVLDSQFGGGVETPRVSGEQILDACCRHFDVSRGALLGSSRIRNLVRARHVAMFLLREVAGESFAGIGHRFNRHHSSVLHAVEKVRAQLESDEDLANDIRQIRRELGLD